MVANIKYKQFEDFVTGIEELNENFRLNREKYMGLITYDGKVLFVDDGSGFLLQEKFTPVFLTESLAILTATDLYGENEVDSLRDYHFVVIQKMDGGKIGTWFITQGFEILKIALKHPALELKKLKDFLGFFNAVFMKNESGSNITFLLQVFLDNSNKKATKAKVASAESALIEMFWKEQPDDGNTPVD